MYCSEIESQNGEQASKIIKEILSWAKPLVTRIWWGEGASPSFVGIHVFDETKYHVFRVDGGTRIEIGLSRLLKKPPLDKENADLIKARLRDMKHLAIRIGPDSKTAKLKIDCLSEPEAMLEFRQFCTWLIDLIEGKSSSQ